MVDGTSSSPSEVGGDSQKRADSSVAHPQLLTLPWTRFYANGSMEFERQLVDCARGDDGGELEGPHASGVDQSEPKFRQLEPHGRLAARRRCPAAGSMSRPIAQALRARTAGRSAGEGRRSALSGTVTTATVLPVMLKNSTEQPSSRRSGTTCRSTTVPTSPTRSPSSGMSRVTMTSPNISNGTYQPGPFN